VETKGSNELVTKIKGVGEERASDLSLLNINTVEDLLYYFPYRYEDRRVQQIENAQHDEKITIEGIIHSEALVRFFGRKKSRISFKVYVKPFLLNAIMFNRPYAKQHITIGHKIKLTGKLDKHRMQLTVQDYTIISEGDDDESQNKQGLKQKKKNVPNEQALLPIYSVTGSISIPYLRKIILQALDRFGSSLPEIIPHDLVNKYKLMPRFEAIRAIHIPEDFEQGKLAKRRLVYEEFLLFQLKMHVLKKIRRENQEGIAQNIQPNKINTFISTLPFQLTLAQNKVLKEIIQDMRKPYAMNRLLQGDVGSGKTIVAAIALFASISAGYQGSLMVPTEILAEQHYASLQEVFNEQDITMALLTGSTKASERRFILTGIQNGSIDLLIGTHALIQDNVFFKQMGLVIIDEQHRFGVEQRRKLRNKGLFPDALFMTATPIPRTLAITAYGDMDVSVIDELPAGRKPIETYWAKEEMFDRVVDFMFKEITKGRQAYFICPLIEESEKLDLQNAIDLHTQLSEVLQNCKVGLMHGKLTSGEKDEIMRLFANNEVQVLVSTTVVEVGVNVPNATLMIIHDAERFGLSQLHQLRGRVGRGEHQSYCILLANPKTEVGKERMAIMQQTNDGFEVAKKDLELRGPGDFFGKKQSGLPEFKLADMIHDYRTLEVARQDASDLVESEEFWGAPQYEYFRKYLREQGVIESDKLD
jgi:ATP-dependent DNA helicase RecG